MAFASLPSALTYIRSGKLQGIAISSAKRSPLAPEIPAIAESYPDCVGEVWVGLFAPQGVSLEVTKTLQAAMEKILGQADLREKLIAQGLDITPVPSSLLNTKLKDEIAKWKKIVKESGAHLD